MTITHLKIKLGDGRELEIPFEEARKLYLELDTLFGDKGTTITYPFVPSVPAPQTPTLPGTGWPVPPYPIDTPSWPNWYTIICKRDDLGRPLEGMLVHDQVVCASIGLRNQ